MVEVIIKAVVTGFILSIMIGPAFFVLLETSIKKGIRAALCFDLGILISDLIYILIAFIFFAEVSQLTKGENENILRLIGGGLFMVYGVLIFLKTPKEHEVNDLGKINQSKKDYIMLFVKGLVLNLTNPMVIFYWFSVMTLGAKSDTNVDFSTQMFIYIGVLLFTFFSIDVLKIIGAKSLRPFITNKVLKSLNRITGAVLMLFGIVLLLQGILGAM